jgi:HTH-type transcriptional regulator/antitoxin HipB
MVIRTVRELGLLLRERRRSLKLSQAELAERIGVTRQWVVEIERGKPRAEIGLVLHAIRALRLDTDIRGRDQAPAAVDLDAILERARSVSSVSRAVRTTTPRKGKT